MNTLLVFIALLLLFIFAPYYMGKFLFENNKYESKFDIWMKAAAIFLIFCVVIAAIYVISFSITH